MATKDKKTDKAENPATEQATDNQPAFPFPRNSQLGKQSATDAASIEAFVKMASPALRSALIDWISAPSGAKDGNGKALLAELGAHIARCALDEDRARKLMRRIFELLSLCNQSAAAQKFGRLWSGAGRDSSVKSSRPSDEDWEALGFSPPPPPADDD